MHTDPISPISPDPISPFGAVFTINSMGLSAGSGLHHLLEAALAAKDFEHGTHLAVEVKKLIETVADDVDRFAKEAGYEGYWMIEYTCHCDYAPFKQIGEVHKATWHVQDEVGHVSFRKVAQMFDAAEKEKKKYFDEYLRRMCNSWPNKYY